MFGDWVRTMRENRPAGSVWAQATRQDSAPAPEDVAEETPARYDVITVDEYRDGDVHVVRAALPGVDPDRDVEITTVDGELRITVEAGPGRDPRYPPRD